MQRLRDFEPDRHAAARQRQNERSRIGNRANGALRKHLASLGAIPKNRLNSHTIAFLLTTRITKACFGPVS
jgi:hypothetical protein